MASNTPNDHKDPYWADLSSATEEKLGLPPGLLTSIVTKGERSNNNQVSEAGAKTPFQIIPATRNAVLDKYGVDAYLSPENAAEAAGLLLQESLKRNDGDVASAVAEYHGGTDKANWGPKTRSYVARVINGQRQAQKPEPQSTFQQVQQSMQPAVSPDAIAQVYDAYKSGKMSPQEKSEFEADVGSGAVMLPRGAVLEGQQPTSPTEKPAPTMLPPEVTDAYQSGKMTEQERADLESDIRSGVVQLSPTQNNAPEFENGVMVQKPAPGIDQRPEPASLGDKIIGAGDAALSSVPMAVAGAAGGIGGTLKGLAEQLLSGQFGTQQAADAVERSATQGAEAFAAPFSPATQSGRDILQSVGETLAPAVAATPFGPEIGAITKGVSNVAPLATGVAGKAMAPIQQAASKITEAIRPASADVQTGAAGARSGGAAAVDAGTLRQAKAQELPVPIALTEGQKSRDFSQQRFERETAKDPELGAPIRERFADQNMKLQQNFDAFIDSTGAEAGDLRSVGQSVDKAIRDRAAADKTKIRGLYKEAEKAGAMEAPVSLDKLIDHLNESSAEASTAPLLNTARQLAIKLKIAKDENGVLVPIKSKPQPYDSLMNTKREEPINLKTAETFRQAINRNTDTEPTNIRQATIMKGLIDEATDGIGGDAYRKARAARTQYAKDYENVGLVKNLIGQKKGSTDRAIALEDIVRRAVIEPSTSLDDVRQVRRLLQTEGANGQQAWKELQGATLGYIKDEALKNVARDQQGNPIVSPAQLDRAIQKLDKNGKLDFVFGKKGAEMLRTVNDVAKDVLVAPPGAVNTSNTASVLAGLMDVAISGTSGVPAPIMTSLRLATKSIKDRKTRARVRKALGVNKKEDE